MVISLSFSLSLAARKLLLLFSLSSFLSLWRFSPSSVLFSCALHADSVFSLSFFLTPPARSCRPPPAAVLLLPSLLSRTTGAPAVVARPSNIPPPWTGLCSSRRPQRPTSAKWFPPWPPRLRPCPTRRSGALPRRPCQPRRCLVPRHRPCPRRL